MTAPTVALDTHRDQPEARPNDALTETERDELVALEAIIDAGRETIRQTGLQIGAALLAINERRLYRATNRTLESYAQDRWGYSRSRAYQLIEAAKVAKNLSTVVDTKTLIERHTRPLAPLSAEDQRVVFQLAKATAPSGRITSAHLKDLASVAEDVMRAGALDDGSGVMVQWDCSSPERKRALLEANLTEEAYERHQRQREHVNQILRSSQSNEWFTPVPIVEAARSVLGEIDLDPASCEQANETVRATKFFDKDHDGLAQPWHGRVWLNPPYGGLAGPFVKRVLDQYQSGHTTAAIVLVNAAATDTNWFQPLFDYPLCFARRVHFDSPTGPTTQATHGSLLAYLGPNVGRFVQVFRELGRVMGEIDGRGNGNAGGDR